MNKMSSYRRAKTTGSYFFTVVSYRRQPILCDDKIRQALRQAIIKTRRKYPFIIDAWVLLLDHLHCIWTLPDGDANFSIRWSLIKREVSLLCPEYKQNQWMTKSKQKHRESTLWQRRFWEHQIRNQQDFNRHLAIVQTVSFFILFYFPMFNAGLKPPIPCSFVFLESETLVPPALKNDLIATWLFFWLG